MKISCCCCTCGNLRIRGQLSQQCKFPNTPIPERGINQISKTLFSIQPSTIEIQKIKKEKGFSSNKPCSDMKCTICGTTFRFLRCHGNSYMERIQMPSRSTTINGPKKAICKNTRKPSQSSNKIQSQVMDEGNELNIESLSKNMIDKMIGEDCDFELMFSNKFEPIVGSYEQKINMPLDGNLSDCKSNSYVA